jgi:soluble lytic murein transglycosylase
VLVRDPDPGYRLGAWFALGRHNRFDEQIRTAAQREQLDPTLVKSIIWRASGFSPGKIGPSNERGLMQIGEKYGSDWAAISHAPTFMQSDLLNPETNLRAGCWYLRKIVDRWAARDHPATFALAEYAAGQAAVLSWAGENGTASDLLKAINDPPTKSFVEDVIRRREYYAAESANGL